MSILLLKDKIDQVNMENVQFVKELIKSEFTAMSEDAVLQELMKRKEACIAVMEETNAIEEEQEQGVFLKDVQYVIVEGIFFMTDLYNFYHAGNKERFKLRVENYVRRERVNSLL